MQRHDMITALGELGLKGMAAAFDDAVTTGLQRNRPAMEILSDLLRGDGASSCGIHPIPDGRRTAPGREGS